MHLRGRDHVALAVGDQAGRGVAGRTAGPVPPVELLQERIARARVAMQSGARASVLTDASGAFAFANLPPGPFTIAVDKSTYLSTRFPERRPFTQSLLTLSEERLGL